MDHDKVLDIVKQQEDEISRGEYLPDIDDPRRRWVALGDGMGTGIEASYDGKRYVDLRDQHTKRSICFMSAGVVEQIMGLFVPAPTAR